MAAAMTPKRVTAVPGLAAALHRSVVQAQVPVMPSAQLVAEEARPQLLAIVMPPKMREVYGNAEMDHNTHGR